MEEYLDLLGTCRRDLSVLRTVLAELLNGCPADVIPEGQDAEDRARRLLERVAPVIGPGDCLVCAQALSPAARRPSVFCSPWCKGRARTLRRRNQLLAQPAVGVPRSGWEAVQSVPGQR